MRFLRSRSALRCALAATALAVSSTSVLSQTFERAWAGTVLDAFTLDGEEIWTVEDGGRIRYRATATGAWTFQTTPDVVKDSLQRIFFHSNGSSGWAVGQNGWVVQTANGGASWAVSWQQASASGSGYEDLWDVHVLDDDAWILGLHGIWHWSTANPTWTAVTLKAITGAVLTYNDLVEKDVELYALDVVDTGSGILGLASAEPGWIFRATQPEEWEVVFEIQSKCPPTCSAAFSPTTLSGCACENICTSGLNFEPWDIEIGRSSTEKLALCVGGVGSNCGLILASEDDGLSWEFEPHECTVSTSVGGTNCNGHVDYTDDPNDPSDVWHLKRYREIYGVSIFHGDNSAIAGGYSGQHLVRDPVAKV
jgi:hypothetical protein